MFNSSKAKNIHIFGKSVWRILIIISLILAIATFVEYNKGITFSRNHIYGSLWFISLWVIMASGTGVYIFIKKNRLSISALTLHIALLMILAGALITHCTSETGSIHLRKNIKSQIFTDENKNLQKLPFQIELLSFETLNYPGTDAPADYISRFTIYDAIHAQTLSGEVSMNRIFTHQGYRFYQTSFDPDGKGSLLSINRDRWGIPVTYSGYFLLFISMLFLLFDKKGRFCKLLKHPVFKERGIKNA